MPNLDIPLNNMAPSSSPTSSNNNNNNNNNSSSSSNHHHHHSNTSSLFRNSISDSGDFDYDYDDDLIISTPVESSSVPLISNKSSSSKTRQTGYRRTGGSSLSRTKLLSHNNSISSIISHGNNQHTHSNSLSTINLEGGRFQDDVGGKSRGRSASSFIRNTLQSIKSVFKLSHSTSQLLPSSATPNSSSPSLDLHPDRIVTPEMALPTHSRNYSFPSNAISNAKYNAVTFLPVILYEQFKFFFNLYFLLVALSQAIPALRIGYLSSYIVPLAFVLIVTMSKEAWDDILRRRRDRDANVELYEVLTPSSSLNPNGNDIFVQAQDLKVGNLVKLHKDQRIPADMILLQSSEHTGESFIRTDQLDGETDWKLR